MTSFFFLSTHQASYFFIGRGDGNVDYLRFNEESVQMVEPKRIPLGTRLVTFTQFRAQGQVILRVARCDLLLLLLFMTGSFTFSLLYSLDQRVCLLRSAVRHLLSQRQAHLLQRQHHRCRGRLPVCAADGRRHQRYHVDRSLAGDHKVCALDGPSGGHSKNTFYSL